MTDPTGWQVFVESLLGALTLLVLLSGLIGLMVPVFPGLTVMWLGTLFYAIVEGLSGHMTWVGWLLFFIITLLMIGGNILDNIIIAKHVRDKNVPWSSIIWAFAAGLVLSLFFTPIVGMIASPAGLYLAEWRRLNDKQTALANTKAWMTGWGWSVAARFGIGLVMLLLWGLWVWL